MLIGVCIPTLCPIHGIQSDGSSDDDGGAGDGDGGWSDDDRDDRGGRTDPALEAAVRHLSLSNVPVAPTAVLATRQIIKVRRRAPRAVAVTPVSSAALSAPAAAATVTTLAPNTPNGWPALSAAPTDDVAGVSGGQVFSRGGGSFVHVQSGSPLGSDAEDPEDEDVDPLDLPD